MMNEDMNNIESQKRELLRELVVSEEHSLEELKDIVRIAKKYVKIEDTTGKILLPLNEYAYTTNEKILLYLICKYITKELNFSENASSTSKEIGENTGVVQTTLSGPLGKLVGENRVDKNGGDYSIKYYNIRKELRGIDNKYGTSPTNKPPQTATHFKKKTKKRVVNKKLVSKELRGTEKWEIPDLEHQDRLLESNGITQQALGGIVSEHKDRLVLLETFGKEPLRSQQIKCSVLALTIMHIKTGSWEMPSRSLRKILETSGVRPITGLSTTIQKFPKYIIHKRGPIGSTATKYQLTTNGLRVGMALIKDSINDTQKCMELDAKGPKSNKPGKFTEIRLEDGALKKNLEEFMRINGLDEDKFRMRFEFAEEGVRILEPPQEKTRRGTQIKALLMLATLIKKVYKLEGFSAKKVLEESYVPTDRLDLLTANKGYKKCFNNSPNFPVRLSYYGEKTGLNLIKEQCGVPDEQGKA